MTLRILESLEGTSVFVQASLRVRVARSSVALLSTGRASCLEFGLLIADRMEQQSRPPNTHIGDSTNTYRRGTSVAQKELGPLWSCITPVLTESQWQRKRVRNMEPCRNLRRIVLPPTLNGSMKATGPPSCAHCCCCRHRCSVQHSSGT